MADDVIAFYDYDAVSGQLKENIQDANKGLISDAGGIPSGFASTGTPLHQATQFAYNPRSAPVKRRAKASARGKWPWQLGRPGCGFTVPGRVNGCVQKGRSR